MNIDKIFIKGFRNIEECTLSPNKGLNILYGDNAQGKTSALEAIWMFTGAKSFRTNNDKSLKKIGCDYAKCSIEFTKENFGNTLKYTIEEKRKFFYNDKGLPSPQKAAGIFNAVVFSPKDLSIITDSPNIRRRYLDISIGQLFPVYVDYLKQYNEALYQRNRCIKDYKYDPTLDILLTSFEEQLNNYGDKIRKYRYAYIKHLNNYIEDIYYNLSGKKENIKIEYIYDDENIAEALKFMRCEDINTGTTSIGPHRDDLAIAINELNARGYASQGQTRSIALALKFASCRVVRELNGEYPILLLDDVLSELDLHRRDYILNNIHHCQTFITVCNLNDISGFKGGNIYNVRSGDICIST